MTAYPGGYSDWQTAKARQEAAQQAAAPKAEAASKPAAPKRDNSATRLSYKERRLLETLPGEIEALEAKVADLNAQLTAPNADYTALSAELAQTQSTLDAAVEQYLTLEEKAEALK